MGDEVRQWWDGLSEKEKRNVCRKTSMANYRVTQRYNQLSCYAKGLVRKYYNRYVGNTVPKGAIGRIGAA